MTRDIDRRHGRLKPTNAHVVDANLDKPHYGLLGVRGSSRPKTDESTT